MVVSARDEELKTNIGTYKKSSGKVVYSFADQQKCEFLVKFAALIISNSPFSCSSCLHVQLLYQITLSRKEVEMLRPHQFPAAMNIDSIFELLGHLDAEDCIRILQDNKPRGIYRHWTVSFLHLITKYF